MLEKKALKNIKTLKAKTNEKQIWKKSKVTNILVYGYSTSLEFVQWTYLQHLRLSLFNLWAIFFLLCTSGLRKLKKRAIVCLAPRRRSTIKLVLCFWESVAASPISGHVSAAKCSNNSFVCLFLSSIIQCLFPFLLPIYVLPFLPFLMAFLIA